MLLSSCSVLLACRGAGRPLLPWAWAGTHGLQGEAVDAQRTSSCACRSAKSSLRHSLLAAREGAPRTDFFLHTILLRLLVEATSLHALQGTGR